MGLDFPFINGLKDQRDEYYYKKIVAQMPQLDNTPELLYGDKELMWLRYINEGTLAQEMLKGDLYHNVKDYKAKGDGTTNDRDAIKAAVDAANLVQGTVYIPPGEYFIGTWNVFNNTGASSFNRWAFWVKDGVTIIGSNGAVLTENIWYDNRRVMFYGEGSNITFYNLSFRNDYDMAGGSRPTAIPIGFGNSFNLDSTTDCNNIRIDSCNFERPWHPTKFAFHDGGASGPKARNIVISNCRSYAEPTSNSSGGFNFRSEYAGKISHVTVTHCQVYDVTVSAAIGYYGVHKGNISANICKGSQVDGAGVQCENGCKDIAVTTNILIDHFNHLWFDDSSHVTATSNICENTDVNVLYKGMRVTKQGFTESPDKVTGEIVFNSNILINCFAVAEAFGTPLGSPVFSNLTYCFNRIYLDGVTNAYGFNILGAKSTSFIGNYVEGALTYSFRLTHDVNQAVIVEGNTTAKKGAEASGSCNFTNTNAFRPVVANNAWHVPPVISQATCMRIGSNWFWEGNGTPEAQISSPVGSWYSRRDGGAGTCFYVKETGTGSTGWVAK